MLTLQLLVNGIGIGVLYALGTVGFALIFWTTKVFHVAHGATYLIAAYAYSALYDTSWVLGVVVSLAAAALFGYLINAVVYRPIQRSSGSVYTLLVGSLGAYIVVQNAISLLFGSDIEILDSSLTATISIGDVQVSRATVIGGVVAAVAFVALAAFLARTERGMGLRAMADDPALLSQIGIDRKRYASLAFVVGSMLVVPAAILTTHLQGVTPSTGLKIGTIAIVAAIVGGVGSLTGAAFGAMTLGIVASLSTLWLEAAWQEAVAYGVLLLVLVIKPAGLRSSGRTV